jgi:hypothetical protein
MFQAHPWYREESTPELRFIDYLRPPLASLRGLPPVASHILFIFCAVSIAPWLSKWQHELSFCVIDISSKALDHC